MTDEKACVFIFTSEAACEEWLDKLRGADALTLSIEKMPAAMVRSSLPHVFTFIADHIDAHGLVPSEESGE